MEVDKNVDAETKGKSKKVWEHHNCCVPQCSVLKTSQNHLHRAPKDPARRRLWEIAIKTGKRLTNSMTVCSEHFQESDYVPTRGTGLKKKLKITVVPSLKLPVKSLQKTMTSLVKIKIEERASRARKRMSWVAPTCTATSENENDEIDLG